MREKNLILEAESKWKDNNMLIRLGTVESCLSAGERRQWEARRKQASQFRGRTLERLRGGIHEGKSAEQGRKQESWLRVCKRNTWTPGLSLATQRGATHVPPLS